MNDELYLIQVSTDDYEVLYIDDILVFSEHRLDLSQVLKSLIGYKIGEYTSYYIDPDVLEDKYGCDFPSNFNEFDFEDLS